jgi:hypothetical protein
MSPLSWKCTFFSDYSRRLYTYRPFTVAARATAWTVFARSNVGIVGSNPNWGMDICVRLFCLRCSVQVAALRRTHPPSKESYRLCIGLRNWKSVQGPTKGLQSHRQTDISIASCNMQNKGKQTSRWHNLYYQFSVKYIPFNASIAIVPPLVLYESVGEEHWLKRYFRIGCSEEDIESWREVDAYLVGSIDWTQLSRFYLKMEIESSLRNVVLKNKEERVFR